MVTSITRQTNLPGRENPETVKKMDEEIAYAKKLETFVHSDILPSINDCLESRDQDEFSLQDLQGLQERLFTCIKETDKIIERYNKGIDHLDLLLSIIARENLVFSNVIANGTTRGNRVRTYEKHLTYHTLRNVSHYVEATYWDGARDR